MSERHISQKQDQMLALLALSWCLSASRPLDGLVDELLRSKHADHLTRLRKVSLSLDSVPPHVCLFSGSICSF
jgi:hypothetical protein